MTIRIDRKKRVLCVDDNRDFFELITVILNDCEIIHAARMHSAFIIAFGEKFDLFLLDYHLEDGTGLDLCFRIRAFDSRTPILFITATSTITESEAFSAGAQGLVRKDSDFADNLSRAVSRFLTLPAALPPPDQRQDGAGSQSPDLSTGVSILNILIVDDDDHVRSFMRRALESEGYRVDEARNGHEALRLYRLEPADLVIADLFMPEKDGLELIREIRGFYHDAVIIAMSGCSHRGSEAYLRASRAFGAHHILVKPFSPEELSAAVREAARQNSLTGSSGNAQF